jgi:hypothetical protein
VVRVECGAKPGGRGRRVEPAFDAEDVATRHMQRASLWSVVYR